MGFGKDGKGAIVKEKTQFALGALASQDVVSANSAVLIDSDFRILRTDLTAVLIGMTSLEGQGLILYMSEGDLTAAEVELNIEQNGPVSMGDQIGQEIAQRWVRRVAISVGPTVNETERVFRNEHNGGLLDIKPRWTFRRRRTATEGGWNWDVYNDGQSLTSGGICHILATHYGVWVN